MRRKKTTPDRIDAVGDFDSIEAVEAATMRLYEDAKILTERLATNRNSKGRPLTEHARRMLLRRLQGVQWRFAVLHYRFRSALWAKDLRDPAAHEKGAA